MRISKVTSYLFINFLTYTSADVDYDFSNYQDEISASVESNEAFKAWKLNRKLAKDEITATVDVHYHVIITNATNGDDVDDATLEKQTAILNEAYSGIASSFYPKDCDGMPVKSGIDTTFRFRHAGVTRFIDAEDNSHVTDEAIESFTDEEMMVLFGHTYPDIIRNLTFFEDMNALQQVQQFLNMTREEQFLQVLLPANPLQFFSTIFGRALRVGDCSTLNVIILSGSVMGNTPEAAVFGYAQRPHWCATGEPYLSSDVLLISRGALPDTTSSSFPAGSTNNLDNVSYDLYRGDTLVHETGHWLNLEHPSSAIDAPSTGKDGCDFLTGDFVGEKIYFLLYDQFLILSKMFSRHTSSGFFF